MSLPARVFVALAFAMVPIAIYAPKGMTALAVAAALALMFDSGVRRAVLARPPAMAVLLWVVVAWAAVTLLWAPFPLRSARLVVSTAALIGVGLVLAAGALRIIGTDRAAVMKGLALAGGLYAILLGIENATDGFVIWLLHRDVGKGGDDYTAFINPGNAILACVGLPFAVAAAERFGRRAGIGLGALVLACVMAGGTTSAKIAAVAAGLVLVLFHRSGTLARRLTAAVFAVGVLVAPFMVHAASLSPGFVHWIRQGSTTIHRWLIWDFVTKNIWSHPVLGWGIDSSRYIPGAHEWALTKNTELLPLHPHSGSLQAWLELGGVGALVVAALLATLPFAVRRAADTDAAAAVVMGTVAAYLVLGQLSFGLWQSWWIATGAIAFALALAAAGPARSGEAA